MESIMTTAKPGELRLPGPTILAMRDGLWRRGIRMRYVGRSVIEENGRRYWLRYYRVWGTCANLVMDARQLRNWYAELCQNLAS